MNKRTEQTRWTPKRLLSLLMALIMTLSLLPTAALAAPEVGNGETYTFDPTITEIKRIDNPDGSITLVQPISANETSGRQIADGSISDDGPSWNLSFSIDKVAVDKPNDTIGATIYASIKGNNSVNAKITEVFVTDDKTGSGWGHRADTTRTGNITVGEDGCARFTLSLKYEVNGTETYAKSTHVVIMSLWTGYNVTYTNDNGGTFTGVPAGNTTKTVAKDASSGDYKQVYTIPADAAASKDNCTFEGWRVSIAGSLSYDTQPGAMLEGITGDVTLTALLPENQEITFDPVYLGVSGLPYLLKATSTGSTYKIPYTPQLANYTFDGWSVTGGTAKIDTADSSKVIDINAPITLTPNWVPAGGSTPVGSHKVTFVRNNTTDGSALNWPNDLTGAKDSTVTIPWLIPQAEGYTFLGWSTSNTENATAEDAYKPGNEVTLGDADINLYAVWQPKNYTITYPGTASLTGVTLTNTGSSITPGRPASFKVTVLAAYDASSMIVAANGVPLGYSTKTENNDGSTTYAYSFVPTGDTAVTVSQPEQKSYVVTLPVGDHFTAKFDGADTKSDKTVTYNDSVSFTVTADSGWTIEDVSYTGDATLTHDATKYTLTNIKSNVAVSVKMKQIPVYTISYSIDEAYFTSQKVTGESANVTLITPAERTGYNFDGWYKNPGYTDKAEATLTVTGDVNLYGRYKPITKSISYDMNAPQDANDDPLTVDPLTLPDTEKTYGKAVTLSAVTPTCDGYDFLGWAKGENKGLVVYAAGATVSEELTADMTLYAVWAKKTYTITLQGGSGYTVSSNQALVVEHGSDFTFTVTVDGAYAATMPTVSISSTANGTLTKTDGNSNFEHKAATYTYTISNVTADQVVTVEVTENARATVTFQYRVVDAQGNEVTVTGLSGKTFMTQAVQLGDPAAQPQQPNIEGYKFVRWCGADHTTATPHTDYDFTKPVAGELTIYAEITPILPVITVTDALNGTGWKTENWKHGAEGTETNAAITKNAFTIAYGDNVTFDLVISKGYDYSKLSVTANGLALGYQSATTDEKTGVTTLHYYLGSVMADTRIAITGIERKTITINYFANAGDDVASVPGPQTDVKYYINETGVENSNIINFTPVRTGYNFLGWCENPAPTGEKKHNANDKLVKFGENAVYQPGDTATFTKDTNLYAIWEAQDTTLTLNITDVALDKNDGKRVIQYEGEQITLQATLDVSAKGTVVFYKGDKEGTNGTRIGSAAINGKTAELVVKVGEYKTTDKDEYYWAVFESETDEGYANSEKSNIMNVGVFSKALSWKITEGTSNVADNGNVLNVYEGDSATGTPITGNMVAGHTYTLQVKTASITGVETLDIKQPVLGKDYKIVWQYTEVGKNDWKTDGEASDKATYLVTGDKSGYQFRAQIVPLGPDNGSLFIKAGKFNENDVLVNDQYDTCLYTKSTDTTVRQVTATALTIDAPEESKDIKINGDTPFTAIGEHKAQFEGQAVTLTAKVTKDGGTGVETGKVEFYRLDGSEWKLIGTVNVETQGTNTGVASTTYTMGAYDSTSAGASATTNKETFKAVYVANETYEKSETDGNAAVYIKSAKLMTPVIESTLAGKLDDTNKTAAQATTYEYNLTELLAGVQHTFTLRQDADQTAKDYSVVALDGRTVDTDNYSIEWQYKTGDNFVKANNESTQAAYTTTTTKVDDRYRVKLTGKGVFAGSEATSKDAVIGTKQNVTVTVKALDAITKTPETDVYQLNEITLTATVAAANDKPTMQPTRTVTFYYKDGDSWVKLDSATLAEDTNHSMTASITTNKLPVTDTTNTWRNVEITAVYEGNDTFNASATVNETAKSITAAAGCTTTNDTVTVYSSVVFNCNDENKKQPTDGDKGIHISVSDGAFKTNEEATLALSDIYTLDRNLDKALRNTIAKLNPTTDYTVQWQKLNGATAITSGDYGAAKNWTNIDGKTGTTLILDKVEQNTAYRAVITVKDQPITKGSFDKLDQGVIGTADANDGRQVYYSNVLMPTDTNMTVSVALNTSKIGAENTEGITEGETVTANVFLSGVVGVVPNANVTVTVTNDSAKGNNTAYEKTFTSMNTVNGWNAFSWNTAESDDKGVPTAPGFYTLTVSATTNTGYAAKEITRSLIVRESSYSIAPSNTTVTYNGRTQGLTVTLDGFDFKGTGINEAANKSWTVRYEDANGNPVEPTQAGTYKAVITLPASAYWTEQRIEKTFTIKQRSVSIADAIAQAKVYDGTTDVNIVEVMLNDAVTDQTTNGTGLPTNNVGIINGDSIYAVATEAKLSSANAGDNSFSISTIELRGDDAANYVWDNNEYTENIYVSRSQVYGTVSSTDVTLKAGEKLPADAVYMIDQAGNKITTYDVLYYLHTDTEIKKVDNTNEKGLYTVIVRPKQDNYKSGVTLKVTVGDTTSYTSAVAPKPSTLITISNTAELYGAAENKGIQTSFTNGATLTKLEYQAGTGWMTDRPTSAGRYLVKVTASTGDVAYGIYTITKAHPSIDFNAATDLTYNSMPQNGYTGTLTVPTSAESYFTYAGDVAIGYNTPADGNVDEQAPVDAGTYTVTLHVNETENYTAHEISKSFTIAKKALTIKADSWQTTQYDAFPDMTAGYTGLAAETGDTTPDTSLRDVQIAPEYLYNPTNGKSNYNNDTLDQVGYVAIQPIDALSKNYAITYEKGQYTKQRTETNVDLDIHGLPQSSTGTNTVYYGDVIQLYPYGYYTTHANGSGIFNWSVSAGAPATIDADKGILKVNGVGEFTVTLKRGVGEQQIKTEINVTAIKKEAKIALKNVDKVYNGASQTYAYEGNVTVHDELYQPIGNFVDSKLTRTNTARTDVGTQVTTAKVTGAWAYQSETYGGKFTINDKDATVAPVADAHIYGTTRTIPSPAYTSTDSNAISNVLTASQTDAYNRLDVHDGYEILVAGAENMNYNVKYTTDETAEDSAVTTYDGMKLYSTTTKAKNELNDATVYGEQANDLDWILDAVKSTTRDSVDYADNLADFDLADTTGIFIKQDKDDCVGNAKTYKAANREEGNTSSTALAADRTATEKAADDNYELVFSSVTNAKAKNYRLDNNDVKNEKSTMTAPTGTVGFIGAPATSDNLIEGSANIAQRPIKLEKAVDDVQLYWKLSQKQLYTALVNVLKAEENSVGRGLAKGHTIEDLDLSFTIGSTPVDKNDDQPMTGLTVGTQTVTVTVGDTNYKLEGSNTFKVDFQTMRIRATYYNKTFTGFDVRIEKIDAAGNSVGPLDSTKGLTFKVLKQTNGVLDTETDYAANKSFTFVSKDGTYGYFHGSYSQLPLLGNGELYVFQMYEYGVPLERK